jgi:hypothetical protein
MDEAASNIITPGIQLDPAVYISSLSAALSYQNISVLSVFFGWLVSDSSIFGLQYLVVNVLRLYVPP